MPQSKYQWVHSPKKAALPAVPESLKSEVETKANELVETVLKPKHVQPPPENPQSNYIEDITTKWYRSYFYFSALYRSAGPHALGGQFEIKLARMEYIGDGSFNLAYMRHTGQWFELATDLPLDACLAAVREDPWFQP